MFSLSHRPNQSNTLFFSSCAEFICSINLIIAHIINMYRRCMLIILLLCVLKTSGQSEEPTDEDYDGNYDDDVTSESVETVGSDLSSLSTVSGTTVQITDQAIESTTILPTVFTTASTTETSQSVETTTQSKERKCPINCKCFDDQVDCSHQNLIQIPKNLPYNTALLNLSHNNLATLNVSDLISYTQLRQLILNDNYIEAIVNPEAFVKLPSLHHIDLTRNALKPLQGMEFSKARGLATLILTSNPNVIEPNVPIVQTHKLKTLNLSNCSITQLSDNLFQNLSSLVALYLEDNPLDMDLNVNAFKYLVHLRTLHIPKVERDVAYKLCEMLETLDMMQLTSETYDLSCFLLTTGSTFEESTVRIGQTTLSTADIESNDLYKIITNAPPSKSILWQKTIAPPKKGDKSFGIEEPRVQSSQKMSPISQNETRIEHVAMASNTTQSPEVQEAQLNVPLEVVYMILIGVIAVALFGLIIGLFCRLDCCGVKTKCCRRAHNRAETEDRVQPHEEIPLNKV